MPVASPVISVTDGGHRTLVFYQEADVPFATHLGHADRRRRFSKAAVRHLGGNSGSGWFLLVCFRTTAAFDMT